MKTLEGRIPYPMLRSHVRAFATTVAKAPDTGKLPQLPFGRL